MLMKRPQYKENPFTQGMVVHTKKANVRLSLGRENNILINQQTGEVKATHVTCFKKVDSAQFVKLFSSNVAMSFGLSSPGHKVLSILIWAVQKTALNKDEVILDTVTLESFMEENPTCKLSLPTWRKGIYELEDAQIIARTLRQGIFFINPNFMFNGDRVVFSTVLINNEAASQSEFQSIGAIGDYQSISKNDDRSSLSLSDAGFTDLHALFFLNAITWITALILAPLDISSML